MTDPPDPTSDAAAMNADEIAQQITGDAQLAQQLHEKENMHSTFSEPEFITKISKTKKKQEKQNKREQNPETAATSAIASEPVAGVTRGRTQERRGSDSNKSPSRKSSPKRTSFNTAPNGRTYPARAHTENRATRTLEQTRLITQLRNRIDTKASLSDTLGIYAALQRTLRSREAEDKMTFAHTFSEHVPEESLQLHRLLVQWFNQEQIYRTPPTLFERMKKLRFTPIFDKFTVSKPVDWLTAVTQGTTHHETTRAPLPNPFSATGRTRFAKHPRAMTPEEKEHIENLIRGIQVSRILPDFCLDTMTPIVHGMLSDAIEKNVRGRLVMQLSSTFQMSKDITYAGKLRQFYSTSPSERETITAFKQILTHIEYDESAHRLVITVLSKQIAKEWHGRYIPLRGRLQQLLIPSTDADGDTIAAAIAMDEYDLAIRVHGGAISALTIRHLFQHHLKLTVVSNVQDSTTIDGYTNPYSWKVTLKNSGCPPVLIDKTCIQWRHFQLWILDAEAPSLGPCTKCAHATHNFQGCSSGNEFRHSNILHVQSNGIDIDDLITPIVALPLGTDYINYLNQRTACVELFDEQLVSCVFLLLLLEYPTG
jgi:hypothetical protein